MTTYIFPLEELKVIYYRGMFQPVHVLVDFNLIITMFFTTDFVTTVWDILETQPRVIEWLECDRTMVELLDIQLGLLEDAIHFHLVENYPEIQGSIHFDPGLCQIKGTSLYLTPIPNH